MSIVRGDHVVLYFSYNGAWQPLACARSCTLVTNAESGETSTLTSGKWRTYRGTKLNWSISFDGLVSFDMNLAVSQLRQVQFSLSAIQVQFTATDNNGVIENFSGYVIITSINTTSTYNGSYEYSGEGLGNGELTITDFPLEPPTTTDCNCITAWYYYDGIGGEYTIGPIAELIDRDIDGRIYRDGVEYRPSGALHDGAGVPSGKEFSFDTATGVIGFDTNLPALEVGEMVDIPYIVCEDVAGCQAVQISVVPLPDSTVGADYNAGIPLSGTPPFTVQNVVKPSWMVITPLTSSIQVTGTPDTAGTGIEVSFDVINCAGDSAHYTDTIDIVAAGDAFFDFTTHVSSDALNVSEIAHIVGIAGSTVIVTMTTYTNNNGGQLKVNGIQAFLNDTWSILLDGSGNGSFAAEINGISGGGTIIRGIFTITSVDSGSIGTPADYQISKVLS